MKKLIWTDEMVDILRNLYPVETNSYTPLYWVSVKRA